MATSYTFNAERLKKKLMKSKGFFEREQTRRLAEYAEREIIRIGDKIQMEDTGNLLDSLCWGVWFNNRLVRNGYYLPQPEAIENSYLHELSPMPPKEEVNGRYLAQLFLSQYQPKQKKGWEVVWGALAPYYAYWERGHYNVLLKTEIQFTAMAERFDHIKQVLKPECRVSFTITVDGSSTVTT